MLYLKPQRSPLVRGLQALRHLGLENVTDKNTDHRDEVNFVSQGSQQINLKMIFLRHTFVSIRKFQAVVVASSWPILSAEQRAGQGFKAS